MISAVLGFTLTTTVQAGAAIPAQPARVDQTSTFKTDKYTVVITTHCAPGTIGCDRVTYKSLSSDGKSITLQGHESWSSCPGEKKKPCASEGFFSSMAIMSTTCLP